MRGGFSSELTPLTPDEAGEEVTEEERQEGRLDQKWRMGKWALLNGGRGTD